jgi:heme-degrading monooxygenase HmoA
MIVRIWRARATTAGAEKYRDHFQQNVLPELKSINGFQKAYLLNRQHNGIVDIEVHTLWDSLEVIRTFAGPAVEAAVVEPGAQAVLASYDRTVTHFVAVEYCA